MEPTNPTVGELVSRVADALGQQTELHLELIKAEVARDARALGREAAPMVLGVPLLALGYTFACVAVALVLASWVGLAGGLALVGVVNLIAGAMATRRSLPTWLWRQAPTHSGLHAKVLDVRQ